MVEALKSLANGRDLSAELAEELMTNIIHGKAPAEQVGALLATLHFRPPNGKLLAGFVRAFRKELNEVHLGEVDAMDVCGTGGDGFGTFNISTAVAFVVAAAGQPVAKHGNRAVSSRCGSFDVLEALGVGFSDTPKEARYYLDRHNLAFLYAPSFHPALRRLAPVRKMLGIRTVFNILGPLLHPASVKRQLIGVYAETLVLPVAEALVELGARHAMVVHGLDGSDELSLGAPSRAAIVKEGRVTQMVVLPEELGLSRCDPSVLAGGSAAENAATLCSIFAGEKGARQDVVALNAAGALLVADRVGNLREGLEVARKLLRSGEVRALLERMQFDSTRGAAR